MTAMTTAEWVSIAPETKLTRADRESGGRGYAYIVADVIGKKAICVTQRMPLAVDYLRGLGLDECKTSSLYDACLRQGMLYRHGELFELLHLGCDCWRCTESPHDAYITQQYFRPIGLGHQPWERDLAASVEHERTLATCRNELRECATSSHSAKLRASLTTGATRSVVSQHQ